jgi:hypothetical protein
MDDNLIRILKEAGRTTEVARLDNGSEVLLLPHGGRVLGLFAAGSADNFYWTNPLLKDAAKARAYFDSDEWQNPGGDRTWLAPELDFFFPKYPDLTVYHQPRQFDARDYQLEKIGSAPGLRIEFEIKHAKQEAPIRVRLAKSIESVANPLRHEAAWKDLDGVTFAGYGSRTTLEFASSPAPMVPVGLWHLIQMPHGGEMFVPTYGPSRPQKVFGDVPPGDLTELPAGGVRYRMTAPAEQKISLRAVSCTGRAAYLYASGSAWQLVLRNFFVNPSGEYVDAPWTEPDDLGYAVQACNVNGKWGIFSELEYHIPAIGVPGAPARCEDFAQVWAYRGARAQIAVVARELLGVDIGPIK